jgi:single-strand DNA-binding protein
VVASFNKVILLGNLTRDPELRHTPAGVAVCTFDLAVNRTFTTKAGERKEEADFFTVVVWDKQAQTCAEYLSKGRQALVEGRLQRRSWEGADGQKRTKYEVVAERVQFIGARKEATPSEAEPPRLAEEEEVPF